MDLKINFKTPLSVIILTLIMNVFSYGQQLLYLDQNQPISKRAEDLLSRMTLEEKIEQLNMPVIYTSQLGKDIESKIDGCRKFVAGTQEPSIGPGGGLFNMSDILCHEGPRRQAELNNEFQKIAVEGTRLKISLIMIDE